MQPGCVWLFLWSIYDATNEGDSASRTKGRSACAGSTARKAGVLALAVLLLTCVLMAGAVSADDISVTPDDNLAEKIAGANNGDVLILKPGKYAYDNLTIDNPVTIKAENPSDKPVITLSSQTNGVVSSLFCINTGDVTLENLIIEGTQQNKAVVGILNGARSGTVTIQDCDIVVDGCNYGLTADAGAFVDIIFTGNTITSKDGNPLPNMAIYINGYDQTYVFQNNIIEKSDADQFGFDLYSGYDLPEQVDISKNYWGGEAPSIDDSIESYLTGQNVYYTQLNDDGTIDEGSLHTPGIMLVSGGSTTYFDTIEEALNEAVDGDTIKIAAGEYELTSILTINKGVTITANNPAAKPIIKVLQVEVSSNSDVTLESLNIVQTGTNLDRVLKFVGGAGDMAVKNCVITALDGGSGVAFSSQGDITFTGNTLTADGELKYGFYMNSYEGASYTFEENIISACTKAQFGVDQKVETLSTPVDISKNYWGGSEPIFERFVIEGGTSALAGQNVYYTQLNDDGTIDEGSLVYGEGALQDLIDNAENGATLKLAGDEYSCPTGLVIDKDITITAADPSSMPKIVISGSPDNGHVGSVQIGVKNVELSYLSFTTTQDQLFYVRDGSDPRKTVTIDHCYAEIPDGTGHFYGDYAGTECNIVLTNNKVESGGTPNLAIYFNVNAKSTYTIEKNIFPECNHKQVGITVYSDEHAPVDISENYWGGSEPTFECFVMEGEAMSAEADDAGLSGQDTYYTELKDDGTIDESSLVSPVEPTPQPTPLPPSYSSSSGNMDNAYRVLFNDGSTTLSVVTDLSSGDKLTKPETPVKDGYTFAGWYKDSACTQGWDFETGIPGDMTLYAKWTAAGSSGETEATATPTKTQTAVTTPQPTKTQTAAATTSAPQATTAAGVSPTLTQAPSPVAGVLFGLLAAGVLLRRRFQ